LGFIVVWEFWLLLLILTLQFILFDKKTKINDMEKLLITRMALTVLIALQSINLFSQEIIFKEKGGAEYIQNLNDIRKIAFTTGKLILDAHDDNSKTFDIETIRYLRFNNLINNTITESKLKENIYNVFPNPAHEFITVFSNTDNDNQVYITILDLNGNELIHEVAGNNHEKRKMIDISTLSNGLYLCKVNVGNRTETKKFIKY